MDIWNTKPGDKVVCASHMEHFWGADRGNAKENNLEIGSQYTVESVDVHSWHTNVFLVRNQNGHVGLFMHMQVSKSFQTN